MDVPRLEGAHHHHAYGVFCRDWQVPRQKDLQYSLSLHCRLEQDDLRGQTQASPPVHHCCQ